MNQQNQNKTNTEEPRTPDKTTLKENSSPWPKQWALFAVALIAAISLAMAFGSGLFESMPAGADSSQTTSAHQEVKWEPDAHRHVGDCPRDCPTHSKAHAEPCKNNKAKCADCDKCQKGVKCSGDCKHDQPCNGQCPKNAADHKSETSAKLDTLKARMAEAYTAKTGVSGFEVEITDHGCRQVGAIIKDSRRIGLVTQKHGRLEITQIEAPRRATP